ncbi:MAG: hypothetical protein R3A44_10600 [Caldilineaceae bacterium]
MKSVFFVVVNMMVKRNRLTPSRQVAKGKEKLGVFATWRDSIISLTITEICILYADVRGFSLIQALT